MNILGINAYHGDASSAVLNTSFNEHEPIVTTPTEALNCYLKTRMDLLALGNWVLTRGAA
jgi:predicted NodU family carbamoyl transferase